MAAAAGLCGSLAACGQKGPLVLPPADVQAASLTRAALNTASSLAVNRGTATQAQPTPLAEPLMQPPAAAVPGLIPADPLFR